MGSSSKYTELLSTLQESQVQLVAVSKTKPSSAILELYNVGQRVFGENRVQEMVDKYEALPKDIEWHMIGGLQKNKVKYIAPFVSRMHSVDSLALAQVINKEALKNDRIINILLQVKIAIEETKTGYDPNILDTELMAILQLEKVNVVGLMGMGTFTDDQDITAQEFKSLKSIFDKLKSTTMADKEDFKELSMGMSGDYQLAIEEGSTMVRIGSLLFGSRY